MFIPHKQVQYLYYSYSKQSDDILILFLFKENKINNDIIFIQSKQSKY